MFFVVGLQEMMRKAQRTLAGDALSENTTTQKTILYSNFRKVKIDINLSFLFYDV